MPDPAADRPPPARITRRVDDALADLADLMGGPPPPPPPPSPADDVSAGSFFADFDAGSSEPAVAADADAAPTVRVTVTPPVPPAADRPPPSPPPPTGGSIDHVLDGFDW